MSPVTLRRYRAERLLRRDFERVREDVLTSVRANLGARKIDMDLDDLEACYSQAWHGLYTVLIEGQELDSPTAWLKTVCFRRAIDEYRRITSDRQRIKATTSKLQELNEQDLASALDDRVKLRHTFEALRLGLDAREQQAASLCYLQGLSRAQAAERMDIGERRMSKLMDGRGPARPGVAAKVDALLQLVNGGGWCEQQASLMRGFAYGIHDPDGERYRLARLHCRECSACRAYVLSLRGLAAVLPPFALPWVPGMAGLGGALGGGAGAGATLGGAAGGGAAGGWLPLGGSLGVKLATGCLLLAGVGGGCVALVAGPGHAPRHVVRRHELARRGASAGDAAAAASAATSFVGRPLRRSASAHGLSASAQRSARRSRSPTGAAGAAGTAQNELGFERTATPQARAATSPLGPTAAGAGASQSAGAARGTSAPPRGAASEFGPG